MFKQPKVGTPGFRMYERLRILIDEVFTTAPSYSQAPYNVRLRLAERLWEEGWRPSPAEPGEPLEDRLQAALTEAGFDEADRTNAIEAVLQVVAPDR